MTKPDHTQQDLIQYLLGSLSESESERFDALGVTHSEFADELSAAENELVDRYVLGRLTADELTRFQSHYLASPFRRDKVEFARTFQRYAEEHHRLERAQPAVAKAAAPGSGFFTWLETFYNPIPSMRWGFALATAMLLAVGAWWVFHDGPRHSDNPSIASFVLAPPLRGNNQVPALPIPNGINEVSIVLELESDDYSTYQVALADESGRTELWRSTPLKAGKGENKRLEVRFPARLLEPKLYSLVVSGLSPQGISEIIASYPFRPEPR
jgi:hypothetical protein